MLCAMLRPWNAIVCSHYAQSASEVDQRKHGPVSVACTFDACGVNAPEYTALPDLDTFAVLPWDTSFARVFCRLYEPDHLADGAGTELPPIREDCCGGCTPASPTEPVWSCAPGASRR